MLKLVPSTLRYICALALLVCSAQCNQICMETIGSLGRLVGALVAPGKSLDKGAVGGKSAPPVPSPLPRSLPTSNALPQTPQYVFLQACLGEAAIKSKIFHFDIFLVVLDL